MQLHECCTEPRQVRPRSNPSVLAPHDTGSTSLVGSGSSCVLSPIHTTLSNGPFRRPVRTGSVHRALVSAQQGCPISGQALQTWYDGNIDYNRHYMVVASYRRSSSEIVNIRTTRVLLCPRTFSLERSSWLFKQKLSCCCDSRSYCMQQYDHDRLKETHYLSDFCFNTIHCDRRVSICEQKC